MEVTEMDLGEGPGGVALPPFEKAFFKF